MRKIGCSTSLLFAYANMFSHDGANIQIETFPWKKHFVIYALVPSQHLRQTVITVLYLRYYNPPFTFTEKEIYLLRAFYKFLTDYSVQTGLTQLIPLHLHFKDVLLQRNS